MRKLQANHQLPAFLLAMVLFACAGYAQTKKPGVYEDGQLIVKYITVDKTHSKFTTSNGVARWSVKDSDFQTTFEPLFNIGKKQSIWSFFVEGKSYTLYWDKTAMAEYDRVKKTLKMHPVAAKAVEVHLYPDGKENFSLNYITDEGNTTYNIVGIPLQHAILLTVPLYLNAAISE